MKFRYALWFIQMAWWMYFDGGVYGFIPKPPHSSKFILLFFILGIYGLQGLALWRWQNLDSAIEREPLK